MTRTMNKRDKIATYYCNARELIKQKNPKAARSYVVAILNEALEQYHSASSIMTKVKTAAFMEKWIAVSRDLYDKGITDYVLECFGLAGAAKPAQKPKSAPKREPVKVKPKDKVQPAPQKPSDSEIDMEGLLDEASAVQGWCAKVFETNKTAVVEIAATADEYRSNGTGFIISPKGYLLTNDHVVFDEGNGVYFSKVSMSFAGEKKKHKLEVLFSDRRSDVALCRFDPAEISFTCVKRIADYSTVKQGADCLVIGNAFGMGLAPFTGIVRFTQNDEGDLVYTAPSNPGDSGGPVFNRIGECIGINKSKTVTVNGESADSYANATPMDKIDALLKKWTGENNIEL